MVSIEFVLHRAEDAAPLLIQYAALQMGVKFEILNAAIEAGSLAPPPDILSSDPSFDQYLDYLSGYAALLKSDFPEAAKQ